MLVLSCFSVTTFFLGIFGIGTCGWVGGGFSGSSRLPGGGGLAAVGGAGCPYCNEKWNTKCCNTLVIVG